MPNLQEKQTIDFNESLLELLGRNLADFTPGVVPLIEKVINNEELSNQEQMIFEANRNAWWFRKFHSDYKNKKKREEILLAESRGEARGECLLPEEVLRAIKKGDQETVKRIKDQFIEEQRDGMEEIEAIFGLADFIGKQQEFSREFSRDKHKNFSEIAPRLQDLTEYQYLFTHLLIKNVKDEKWLRDFWATGESVARALKSSSWEILTSGLRSQAAAYWVIKELGHKPRLSSPDEDAFKSIDLWGGENEALQIKGSAQEKPALIKVNTTDFPGVEVKTGADSRDFYTSQKFSEIKDQVEKFKIKLDRYGKGKGENNTDKKYTGYVMVIPGKMIDKVTCRPNEQLVKFFRQEIDNKESVPEVELAA